MQSGHYVQVRSEDSVDTLAKEFSVSKELIETSNPDKKFSPGEWVYIPLKRGILSQRMDSFSTDPSLFFSSGEFLWPVPSSRTMTSNYGWRWGRRHEGVDISARIGSYIVAAQNGIVVYSGDEIGGYGNITVIAHKNGLFTVYAHALKNFTQRGQRVFRGQVIAQVGMTGRTYGPHLHFEVRRNGESLNPVPFLAIAPLMNSQLDIPNSATNEFNLDGDAKFFE